MSLTIHLRPQETVRLQGARRRLRVIIALASLAFASSGAGRTACAQAVQTITVDGAAPGRAFEGVSAVSGGGNTSRLLPDYPDAQRKQILDYLFKPQFAASLPELKVEVGGDVNSTQGSEPSHMHTRDDENYTRGFEWWLMEQAKARNPQIGLGCLAWGAPGWVGNGNFWSADMMDYYIRFIKGAKRYHNLDISNVGGRNERGYDRNWYVGFRKALNNNGLASVKLVGSDDWGPGWLKIANQTTTDPALAAAVDAISGHVTWSENPGAAPPAVLATGKPLWDTEMHNYITGFDAEISLVNDFNTNYIKTKITKTQFWNLLWATYPVSSYPNVGMIQAISPWSGHYEVQPVVWGYAHVNQFVKPGWRFLENGGNGSLVGGGTYTALKAPQGKDYSVIAETKGAAGPQTIRFVSVHGLSGDALHVWKSTAAAQFVRVADVTPTHGTFSLVLDPDSVYSLTTTSGQRKGGYPAPPAEKPLSLPYRDDYQNYPLAAQARYHYDYEGAFEIARKTLGTGKCLRQAATRSASGWGGSYLPLTFLGSSDWKDYAVSADVYIENAGAVSVHGRIGNIPGDNRDDPPGYTFRMQDTGAWELKRFRTVLVQGRTAFSANAWHTLKLDFRGAHITGFVDGSQVCAADDTAYGSGLVGLGSGWNFAQFSNLRVEKSLP